MTVSTVNPPQSEGGNGHFSVIALASTAATTRYSSKIPEPRSLRRRPKNYGLLSLPHSDLEIGVSSSMKASDSRTVLYNDFKIQQSMVRKPSKAVFISKELNDFLESLDP